MPQKNFINLPLWIGVALVVVVVVFVAFFKLSDFTPGAVTDSGKALDTSKWRVTGNTEYAFQVKHPNEIQVVDTEGSSDLMGRFLSFDFGTEAELDALRQANQAAGVGGPALFLRLTVADNSSNQKPTCGEFGKIRDLVIDGERGVLCGGETMVSDQVMMAMVTHEGRKFVFESGKYTEQNKDVIDEIVGSLEFTR